MRRALVLVALLFVALFVAACSTDNRFLAPGEYAGSTSADQAFRISIGDKLKVNGHKAEWDERGAIRAVGLPGKPVVKCVTLAKGEELRCEFGGETIELMKE